MAAMGQDGPLLLQKLLNLQQKPELSSFFLFLVWILCNVKCLNFKEILGKLNKAHSPSLQILRLIAVKYDESSRFIT